MEIQGFSTFKEFFEKNSDLLPYKKYVTSILSNFVDKLEGLLIKQITVGESLIYHKLVDNTGYFKEIINQLKMLSTPSIDFGGISFMKNSG